MTMLQNSRSGLLSAAPQTRDRDRPNPWLTVPIILLLLTLTLHPFTGATSTCPAGPAPSRRRHRPPARPRARHARARARAPPPSPPLLRDGPPRAGTCLQRTADSSRHSCARSWVEGRCAAWPIELCGPDGRQSTAAMTGVRCTASCGSALETAVSACVLHRSQPQMALGSRARPLRIRTQNGRIRSHKFRRSLRAMPCKASKGLGYLAWRALHVAVCKALRDSNAEQITLASLTGSYVLAPCRSV